MACNNNCRRLTGVAFGSGISPVANQSSYLMGAEVVERGFTPVVSEGSYQTARQLPLDPLRTRLEPSKVRIAIDPPELQPQRGVVVQSGYVVLRSTGAETGLAVVPGLNTATNPKGTVFREDLSQWWVLHINSGRTVSLRGYSNPKEAQTLASILARQDWINDNTDLREEDIQKARQTAELFDQVQGYED